MRVCTPLGESPLARSTPGGTLSYFFPPSQVWLVSFGQFEAPGSQEPRNTVYNFGNSTRVKSADICILKLALYNIKVNGTICANNLTF